MRGLVSAMVLSPLCRTKFRVFTGKATFTTTLPRHRIPSCASGGTPLLVGSPEGTRGSRTAGGHEMPVLLLHFDEVDTASLTGTYYHQFVIHKKIVACRHGRAYPDGQRASPPR